MNTVSMNSGNKVFETHRLLFNLSDEKNLKRSNSYVSKIKNTLSEVKRWNGENGKWWKFVSPRITEVVLIHFNVIKNDYQ